MNGDENTVTKPENELAPETEPQNVNAAPSTARSDDVDLARAEANEWREKYLRLLAEFDNFRKRVRQDTEMQRSFAAESLILGLLPIIDDLDRMLATSADADDPYRRGAELIREKLHSFLKSRGVQVVESLGAPFDPEVHDALLMRPTNDFPAGTVLEVIVPGYRLGDRMIRHAQVVVSEAFEPTESGKPAAS